MADLKYLTYLLAFDRTFVANALEDAGLSGDDYLQKIVQASFELPLAEPGSVHKVFFDRLSAVIADVPQEEFDKDRVYWGNLFSEGLRHILSTPRQVILLTNSLSLTFPVVVGEVNTPDFVAIEALRLFYYPVYQAIRNNQDYFVSPLLAASFSASATLGAQREIEEHREFHERWLGAVEPEMQPHIKALVRRMFPKLESVWGTVTIGTDPQLRARLRICTADYFPVYFRLGVSSSELAASELQEILSLARDPEKLARRLVEIATGP